MFTWSTLCPRWLKSRVSKCILDLGNSCWQQQDSLFCQCLWTKRDETVFLARETKTRWDIMQDQHKNISLTLLFPTERFPPPVWRAASGETVPWTTTTAQQVSPLCSVCSVPVIVWLRVMCKSLFFSLCESVSWYFLLYSQILTQKTVPFII